MPVSSTLERGEVTGTRFAPWLVPSPPSEWTWEKAGDPTSSTPQCLSFMGTAVAIVPSDLAQALPVHPQTGTRIAGAPSDPHLLLKTSLLLGGARRCCPSFLWAPHLGEFILTLKFTLETWCWSAMAGWDADVSGRSWDCGKLAPLLLMLYVFQKWLEVVMDTYCR